MADAGNKQGFISDDTERKLEDFEAKLKAEQAAMPDTSIRSGAGGINVLDNYYFGEDSIPIYDSGTNKQIDRVDMEVDKLRRSRRTGQVQDEVDEIMHRIHEEREAEKRGETPELEHGHKTEPFVFAVPIVIIIIALIFIAVSMAAS